MKPKCTCVWKHNAAFTPKIALFASSLARISQTWKSKTDLLHTQTIIRCEPIISFPRRPYRMFSTQMVNETSESKFEKYPKIRQLLDSARMYVADHTYLKTVNKDLFPLLENQQIRLTSREYWLVFRLIAQTRAYWLSEPLLSYYKRDYGTPSPLIYDKLFELEGKRDLNRLLAMVEEAKNNRVRITLEMHTTVLKGIASRGTAQILRDYMNQIKQSGYQLDVLVYSVYLEGLAHFASSFREVLEGLKEMQQQNIPPNSIVLNGILNKLIRNHKSRSIEKFFEKLVKQIPPNNQTFEILLKHAAVIQNERYFNTIWNLVPTYNLAHTESMFNSLVYLNSRNGNTEGMIKAYQEMQEVGLAANRLTYAFLIEGYIKRGEVQSVISLLEKITRPTTQTIHNVVDFLKKRGEHEQVKKILAAFDDRSSGDLPKAEVDILPSEKEDKELLEDMHEITHNK